MVDGQAQTRSKVQEYHFSVRTTVEILDFNSRLCPTHNPNSDVGNVIRTKDVTITATQERNNQLGCIVRQLCSTTPFNLLTMRAKYWFLVYAALWLVLFDVAAAAGDGFTVDKLRFLSTITGVLLTTFPEEFFDEPTKPPDDRPRQGHRHRSRERKYVNKMFNEYGPTYARRAYRMKAHSFWKLEKMLRPLMARKRTQEMIRLRKRDGARNGRISNSIRLSAAIRYFAGGRPDDIMLSHGISHSASAASAILSASS